MSEQNIVFYAAGRNAEKNLHRWESQGLVPLCFADADTAKHGTKMGKYEILSLEGATARHPGCKLYVTTLPRSYPGLRRELISRGIPGERIDYPDKGTPKQCGDGLWNVVTILPSLKGKIEVFCCASPYRIHSGGGEDAFEAEMARNDAAWKNLNHELAKGNPTDCDCCPRLRNKTDRTGTESIKTYFAIGSGITGGTRCNFRCCYDSACDAGLINGNMKTTKTTVDILRYIIENYGGDEVYLDYAAAEIALSEYRDEILDMFLESRLKCVIFTNASIYVDKIAALLESGRSILLPSIDAGTRETYARVKNADCFEKVLANLRRYAAGSRHRLLLKYILLEGVNDGDEDIDSFAELAHGMTDHVLLSFDYRKRASYLETGLSPHYIGRLIRFLSKCTETGVTALVDSCILTKPNWAWIGAMNGRLYKMEEFEHERIRDILRRG
jgi:hypothetical protein